MWQLLESFTNSAASRLDTSTMLCARRAKNSTPARSDAASSPPITCGSSTSSRNACPWMVRSGAITSLTSSPHAARSSGSTTRRLVPTGTVLRTTTSVPGRQVAATARAAAARFDRSGRRVASSTGVDTLITATSTTPCGSSVPAWIRWPASARKISSTPGSKMCDRPCDRVSTTFGDTSAPYTVKPLSARAAVSVRPTYPRPTTPIVMGMWFLLQKVVP